MFESPTLGGSRWTPARSTPHLVSTRALKVAFEVPVRLDSKIGGTRRMFVPRPGVRSSCRPRSVHRMRLVVGRFACAPRARRRGRDAIRVGRFAPDAPLRRDIRDSGAFGARRCRIMGKQQRVRQKAIAPAVGAMIPLPVAVVAPPPCVIPILATAAFGTCFRGGQEDRPAHCTGFLRRFPLVTCPLPARGRWQRAKPSLIFVYATSERFSPVIGRAGGGSSRSRPPAGGCPRCGCWVPRLVSGARDVPISGRTE